MHNLPISQVGKVGIPLPSRFERLTGMHNYYNRQGNSDARLWMK